MPRHDPGLADARLTQNSNTIQASPDDETDSDEEQQAEFIGFTVEGGPIVRFTSPQARLLSSRGDMLGYADGDRPIVAFEKGTVTFVPGSEAASVASSPGAAKGRRGGGG